MAKIAYQGIAGAYSHIASVEQFGTQNTFMGVSDFSALFAEVTNRRVDFGVVPIENSLAGSVVENFDFLYKNEVYIIEERYMRIEHQLLGISIEGEENESRIAQLTHIFSHPKALEQCLTLFKEHPAVQKMPYEDTAGAAKYVKQMEKKEFGAIASKQAADLYGLSILKRNVEDNPNNWTRFVIIVPDKQDIFGKDEEGTYKCSAIFTLQNRPGALYTILGYFAKENLNLTKIESRPIQGTQFEHFFYVDFEFTALQHELVHSVLEQLKEQVNSLKVLGYYKKHTI